METSPRPASANADPAKALLQQAKILLDADRPEQAVPLLLRALSLAPDDALIPCHLSYTYSKLGDRKQALQFAEEAIARKPDNEWAHRLRGHVFWTRGNYKEAMKCALEAQRVDPDEAQVYRMQADLFLAQRKYKEAKQAAETMRRLAPDQAAPFVLLARATLALAIQNGAKRAPTGHKEAEAFARQALALAPDLPAAHNVLGEALQAQHKTADAMDAFYRASQLDPTAQSVQRNLSNTVFTRFFVLPVVLLAIVLFPMQILFYRWGGIWAAGIGGAFGAGLCTKWVVRRFATRIALHKNGFRKLPDAQRETLMGLMRMRKSPLISSAAGTAGILSALPALILLWMGAKNPPSYREAIRALDHAVGRFPTGPANWGQSREVYPWQITVQNMEEKQVAVKKDFMAFMDAPWLIAARKPGQKLIVVRVSMRNEENTTYMPSAYPSYLENAQGSKISKTLNSGMGSGSNLSESQTAQTGGAWKPYEEKTIYLMFVVEKNERPATMVMESPTDESERAEWRLTQ